MSKDVKDFTELKERVDDLKTQLAEAKGRFKEAKEQAKEQFGTSNTEELEEIKKQTLAQIEKLEIKIEKKANELDKRLSEIEDNEEHGD